MAQPNEPMTFDDLTQLYREEVGSNCIIAVRKDLYRAVANLLTTLRQDYEKLLSIDPESIMCDGANLHFKNAESSWRKIVNIRAKKICNLAIRTAGGSGESSDILADDEQELFATVLFQTRALLNRVNTLRGRHTRDTRIDVDFVKPEPVPQAVTEVPDTLEAMPVSDDMFDEPFDEPIPDPEDFYIAEEPQVSEPRTHAVADPVPVADEVIVVSEECSDPLIHQPGDEVVDDEMMPVPLRILEDLPEFVGPQRTYCLRKEDVVTMPLVMAEALVNSGKAVRIKPSS